MFPFRRTHRHPAALRPGRGFRPLCEVLEDRIVPFHCRLQFGLAAYSVAEGGTVRVGVTRTEFDHPDLSVQVDSSDGTATAGADYVAVHATLHWADGDTATKFFDVQTKQDAVHEANETVTLTLSHSVNTDNIGGPVVLTIIDDDPATNAAVVQFARAGTSIGEAGPAALVAVTRTGPLTNTVSVRVATGDGTARAGADYTAVATTLTWAAGDGRTQTVRVPVRDDRLDEAGETFFVTLSRPTGGATLGPRARATVTIADNDPTPTLRIGDVRLLEGKAGTALAVFTVSLSAASGQTVRVNAATADGTARAGSDYIAGHAALTFLPGQTRRQFAVRIKGDVLAERDETFFVNLSAALHATVSDGRGVAVIRNDDRAAP